MEVGPRRLGSASSMNAHFQTCKPQSESTFYTRRIFSCDDPQTHRRSTEHRRTAPHRLDRFTRSRESRRRRQLTQVSHSTHSRTDTDIIDCIHGGPSPPKNKPQTRSGRWRCPTKTQEPHSVIISARRSGAAGVGLRQLRQRCAVTGELTATARGGRRRRGSGGIERGRSLAPAEHLLQRSLEL